MDEAKERKKSGPVRVSDGFGGDLGGFGQSDPT
jgi:hypothetical protein